MIYHRFALSVLVFVPISLFSSPREMSAQSDIVLRNDHVELVVSDNAVLKSCIDLATGKDIASTKSDKIAYGETEDGKKIEADSVSLSNDILTVYIGKEILKEKVYSYNDFFIFEVISSTSSRFPILAFLSLKFQYSYTDDSAFVAAGLAMSLQTDPVYYPSGESQAIMGRCTKLTGIKGAKLAVICCAKRDLRKILKSVYKLIPKGDVPFSEVGGPFALDGEINKGDCMISFNAIESVKKEQISFCKKYGIQQVAFHTGPETFIQGDFSFPTIGSASDFKTQISDPLLEDGIASILHTYAFFLDYDAKDILSNPKWQQQLDFRESLTLREQISTTGTRIELSGDCSCIKNNELYWKYHTPFLLIDNEIIRYSLDANGFTSFQRGMCGTMTENHQAGAKVRIIGGQFSCIAPQIGSELYYEIARRTAKAYNEGGFQGIYFDAYDGLYAQLRHTKKENYLWYYGAAFINEVLKNCKVPPLVEYSALQPTIWGARGRAGAWDTPFRGYKDYIDDHLKANKTLMNRFYVTTFGWYNFYPVFMKEPENYSTKYMFFDDVEYLGTKFVAYDQTMVYNGLKEKDVVEIPAMQRNLDLFNQYNKLRKNGYFSKRVKDVLKSGRYEYKLEKKRSKWGFREMEYSRSKLRNILNDSLKGNNPFDTQHPFIRLESLYSSDCNDRKLLMEFDESKDFYLQNCKSTFSPYVNLANKMGLRIEIKGNGYSSSDAICVRLETSSFTGVADYVIRLNFDGWREIILSNLDNAEDPKLEFEGMEDNLYRVHRLKVDYSKVSSIGIFKSGKCNNVRIRKIEAVPLIQTSLISPEVYIGKEKVVFKTILKSGEYIEYQPRTRNAFAYDRLGNERLVEVVKKGEIRVPKGKFFSFVRGRAAFVNVPSAVVLTIGLSGKFISN